MDKILAKTSPSLLVKNVLEDKLVKKLAKTTSIVLLGNIGASLLNFVSFTIVVNALGAKLLALFALAQTYTMIVNAIFNIQTWESVVKFGHSESSERTLANVVKINFLMDLVSALIAFVAAIILMKSSITFFTWDTEIAELILWYSLTIPFNLTTFKIGIPRLFDKFSAVAKIQVCTSVLKLLLVLAAIFTNQTIVSYVIIYLLADVLNSLILIVYSLYLLNAHGHGGWLKEKLKIDPYQMNFVWWINLRSVMRIPVRYCDMVVISMIMPLETVGIYKVYKEIAGFLGRIGDPVNQAIYPEYSRLIGNNASGAAASLAKKTFLLLLALSSVMTVLMILLSGFFVGRFYGPEFLPSINALYILIALFGISVITVPVDSLFVAAGFAKLGFYVVMLTNLLYLFVTFAFGRLFGIYGIILAYGIQLLFNKGLKVILLKRYHEGWNNIIR